MSTSALGALWNEPRLAAPAGVPRGDRVLAAVLVPVALVEGLVRDDLPWPAYSIALAIICPIALLWRTRHPLAMLVIGFGAQTLASVGPVLAGQPYGVLSMTACVLLLPYSLARWGSGRSVMLGLVYLAGSHLLREPLYESSWTNIMVGLGFLMLPAALGAAVRFGLRARRREGEQIKMREREQLARELHDTVAHYVSGIVVQAQAGQVVAATDPGRALDVLRTVELEATRSLAEMRSLVGILRDGDKDHAERAPAHGLVDLDRLARENAGEGTVDLSVVGDAHEVGSTVEAAVYRIVQESITNARTHAQGATRIGVEVVVSDEAVEVTVSDDGRPGRLDGRDRGSGYGLVGMRERVQLLGGSLKAGPAPQGGWIVRASIPRTGVA